MAETNLIPVFENFLLQDELLPLHMWYAQPLDQEQAKQLLEFSAKMQKSALMHGKDVFEFKLRELIARFFLNKNIQLEYQTMSALLKDDRQRAQLELVYGQLLISRKLAGAHEHLKQGFLLARPFIESAFYFGVMKQHEQLAIIKTGNTAVPALSLEDLITEAGVIRKLEKSSGKRGYHCSDPEDTLG